MKTQHLKGTFTRSTLLGILLILMMGSFTACETTSKDSDTTKSKSKNLVVKMQGFLYETESGEQGKFLLITEAWTEETASTATTGLPVHLASIAQSGTLSRTNMTFEELQEERALCKDGGPVYRVPLPQDGQICPYLECCELQCDTVKAICDMVKENPDASGGIETVIHPDIHDGPEKWLAKAAPAIEKNNAFLKAIRTRNQ